MRLLQRLLSLLLLAAILFSFYIPQTNAANSNLNVMSFNIKNTNISFSSIASMVSDANVDIVGMQEVNVLQHPLLSAAMSAKGYSCVQGNDRGDGEQAPIFYNSSKLTLFRSGSFWLSDTPTTESKYDESSYYRICTWGCFQITGTSEYFLLYNTHLDFGAVAIKQLNVLLADMIVKTGDLPKAKNHLIITGDFNFGSATTACNYLLGDTPYSGAMNSHTKQRMDEARQIAASVVNNSFGNYYTQPATAPTADLDHIFVSSEGFTCSNYQVLSNAAGSDHLPVLAKLTFKTVSHNYKYTYNGDSTHTITCSHCTTSSTKSCSMVDGYCSYCGGKEIAYFKQVTSPADLTSGRYVMALAATGTYSGNSSYYAIGLKQDSGFRALSSYGLSFTSLPDTFSLDGADLSNMVWLLDGTATGFTLKTPAGKSVYHDKGTDLLLSSSTSTFTADMNTTTFHFAVKHNSTNYLSLRADINTLSCSDINNPLVNCVGNTSTGNYKIFFFKEYTPCSHQNTTTQTTAATCVSDGKTTIVCADCGEIIQETELTAIGHSYKAATTAASCTTAGYTTYTCSLCGDSYTDSETAATGHSYSSVVTAPTCITGGYTTYTCSLCGDSYADNETSATGHSYSSVITAPTCITGGYTTYTCSLCGDSYATDQTAATGHIYSDGEMTKEPTCTSAGIMTYQCACGITYTQTISASGHSYKTTVTAPTCTASGYTTYTCTVCAAGYTSNRTSALGHSYNAVVTNPTCTEIGYTTNICNICAQSYVSNRTSALGHSYQYTNQGSNHTVSCLNCSYQVSSDHSYSNNTCICGATKAIEYEYVLNENLSYIMSISAGAEMQVVYTITASKVAAYEDFYLLIVKTGEDDAETTTTYGFQTYQEAFIPITNASGAVTGYQARYTGINAKEMGDSFCATLYAVSSEGIIYYSETKTGSMKSYLMSKIKDSSSTATFKTLAVDMLNYGAAAQIRLGYNTDNLVNSDLTATEQAYGTQVVPTAVNRASQSGTGSSIFSSVSLQSKVLLYLNTSYTPTSPDNLYYFIQDSYTGEILTVVSAQLNEASGLYQGIYENVGAREMRKLFTITLYDDTTAVSKTLTWSIESYVASVRAKSNATEAEIVMANAMLAYGDSVAAYLTETGQ